MTGFPASRRSARALRRLALTIVLGLARRAPAGEVDRTRRGSRTSSYEAPVAAANELQFGRAYWLPPFGRGNGIDALFWTMLAELPRDRVDAVLEALAERDIPAWAAAAERRGTAGAEGGPQRLWVASGEVDAGQDVLMRVLAA